MNKFLILSLFFIFTCTAYAEVTEATQAPTSENNLASTFLARDRVEIGGSLNFVSESSSGNSRFNLSPFAGYFIRERLSINAQLGMFYSSTDSKITGLYGVGATYYIETFESFAPFVSQNFTRTYGYSDESHSGDTGIGALVFIRENVALKTSAIYDYNFESKFNEGNFALASALSFFF